MASNLGIPREVVAEAIAQHEGNLSAAARALGVSRRTVRHHHHALKDEMPEGTYGTSTLERGQEGSNVVLRWVKRAHNRTPLTREQIIDVVRGAMKGAKPLPRLAMPKKVDADMLSAYPMGDPHIGQYSWGEETGDDYDLDIAEQLHCDAMDNLIARSPASQEALLINIGDYFHANDHKSRTPQSQHALDVDTRHGKVLRVGIRIQERMIQRALQKHKRVRVINCSGNHDPEAALVLPIAMECLFRNNPRVTIDNSPKKFSYHRFGQVLIGCTHGDTVKIEKLGELMATDMRREWGQTDFHHWFSGHWHHKKVFEGLDFTAEVLRTLAGKDAYAASHGYRSQRDMQCVVFHKYMGEYERHRVDVKHLQAA
jgi:hypothetical protein